MSKVRDRYVKAISKIVTRRNRQGRDKFTANEDRAIKWYGQAVQQIEKLIQGETNVTL